MLRFDRLVVYLVIAIMLCGGWLPIWADKKAASPPQTVISVAPPRINTILKKGVTQFRAGDNIGAEKLFKQALKIDPGNETANFNLGVIAERRGDLQGALHDYQLALQAKPNDRELQAAVSETSTKLAASNNNMFSESPSNHIRISRATGGGNTGIISSGIATPHCPICSMASYNPNYQNMQYQNTDHCSGCNSSSLSNRIINSALQQGLGMAMHHW